MKREQSLPRSPGFWKTVGLLLSVARRRARGRIGRQQDLLQQRTGSRTNTLGLLGIVLMWLFMAGLNIGTVFVIHYAIREAQTAQLEQQGTVVVRTSYFWRAIKNLEYAKTDAERSSAEFYLEEAYAVEAVERSEKVGGSQEENARLLREAVRTRPLTDFIDENDAQPGVRQLNTTGPLPKMFATLFLIMWLIMLICQGEGLELDIQRRRHPMWEWLFSHPVKPSAVFLAEMLSPIAANPIFTTAPLFFGFLYGSIYGRLHGFFATLLIGVPVAISLACIGKALEIGIMLRFPPRSRGALIGLISWLGYSTMVGVFVFAAMMPTIVGITAPLFQPLASAIPWPLFSWIIGLKSDGSFSFISGMLVCWLGSSVLILGSVGFSVWGAQRGLLGASSGSKPISTPKSASPSKFFKADPLYRKEILWFLRDRGAIVQAILIPVTVAAFQLFNLRMIVENIGESWRAVAGMGVVFGTYFLWILGPRSLASEGQALWVAQTWPRGLEELMKAKARLWSLIATVIVMSVLVFAAVRSPGDAWKVLLIAAGWIAFARSMAEKSVTLVTVTSSSGEQEPIPQGRRWAASLGMFSFAVGVLSGRWQLMIVGIVYSWITAAAMWENFRARLPFLFDPWSEKLPPAPTLMHGMIAISAQVEGGAIVTGVLIALFGFASAALAQTIAFAVAAIVVSLFTASILANRGVTLKDIWRWPNKSAWTWLNNAPGFVISIAIGGLSGLLLGLLAKGYLMLLSRIDTFSEMLRVAQEELESVPNLRISYAIIAVAFAPIAEEYLFRGLLYRALDRAWGGWPALLGSALFFTIYHQPISWLPVFLVGVATALVFKKTGRLAPAVVLHMVYNAVVV